MNCVEAQNHFADLLDHSRAERLFKVNDHLAACSRCRQELAALAACQRLVSALPPVEPPVGFATRIMAEVRDAAGRPNLWRRLFSSIQNLPLQVTAVILINVLAVFIYQKEFSQQPSTTVPPASGLQKQAEADKSAPGSSGAPALESEMKKRDASGAQEAQPNPSFQSEQPRSPAKPEEQSNIRIGGTDDPGARNTAPPASGHPSRVAPSRPREDSSPAVEDGSVRQEQSLRSGGARMERVPQSAPLHDNDTASQDRTLGGHSRSSAGLEEKKARSSLDALDSGTAVFSDRDLILRLKQTARDDSKIEASSELEHFQAGASPSRTRFKDFDGGRQRAIQTGQPQTVSTIIDVSQYDGFKKELASLGKIESEMPAAANEIDALPKSSAQLRITVTILPPLPSANTLPTQPSSR